MKSLQKIEWSKKFLSGNKEVDLQHQYFAELINRIIQEVTENSDLQYQNHLMQELMLYASFHFQSEENILYKLKYPYLENHRALHLDLLDNLSNKIKNTELTHDNLQIIDFLIKWFVGHTIFEDKECFSYIYGH